MTEKTLFSIEEAAEKCGVSRMTIYRWIKAGKIKPERIGKKQMVPLNEIAKCGKELTSESQDEIRAAVKRVATEYRETLELLAKE